MKKFKMTQQNLNLLLAIGGIAIFLVVYLLVFKNFSAKNEELDSQIENRTQYLAQLEEYNANIQEYEDGIVSSRTNIDRLLARLPVDLKVEDFILFMKNFHDSMGLKLPSVSVSEAAPICEFQTMYKEAPVNVTGCVSTVSISTSMTYAQLKQYLNTIYDETAPVTMIDNITITYDSANAKLNVNTSISKYSVKFEGGTYVPYPIYGVDIGAANPFRSTTTE